MKFLIRKLLGSCTSWSSFRFPFVFTACTIFPCSSCIFWICLFDSSSALHIEIAFSKVNLSSLNNLSFTFSELVPQTILSRIKSFFMSPNSQSRAIIFRSVTNWSINSVLPCVLVLNLCLSIVTFFLGMQYDSNFSNRGSNLSFCSSAKTNVLNISRPSFPIT